MFKKRESQSSSPRYTNPGLAVCVLIFLALLFVQTGCAKQMGQYPCAADECFGQDIWQKSIDRIASHNFPKEHYYGRVYTDRLNNAWTTDDNYVNISEDLLIKLVSMGDTYVLSVSAHEIAHIRSHHFSRKASLSQFSSVVSPGEGPFSYRAKKHKAKLSRENELEADELAAQYMENAGYKRKDYLNFLKWMKSNLKDAKQSDLATHPPIKERITRIEQLKSSLKTASKNREGRDIAKIRPSR